jgi:hypothetical protein
VLLGYGPSHRGDRRPVLAPDRGVTNRSRQAKRPPPVDMHYAVDNQAQHTLDRDFGDLTERAQLGVGRRHKRAPNTFPLLEGSRHRIGNGTLPGTEGSGGPRRRPNTEMFRATTSARRRTWRRTAWATSMSLTVSAMLEWRSWMTMESFRSVEYARRARPLQPALSITMLQTTRRKTYRSLTENQRIQVFNMRATARGASTSRRQ